MGAVRYLGTAVAGATDGLDVTLTVEQAAALAGVTPATIRSWVRRGHLAPVRRHAKPSLFREADVIDCRYERMSRTEHETLDTLWTQVLAHPRRTA